MFRNDTRRQTSNHIRNPKHIAGDKILFFFFLFRKCLCWLQGHMTLCISENGGTHLMKLSVKSQCNQSKIVEFMVLEVGMPLFYGQANGYSRILKVL